ncbi:MAG: class I SAM-dependent methyltransferase [Acidimicrobiales bacterium]
MGEAASANQYWRQSLATWAIPEALIAAAPASPYFFDPQAFITAADEALARSDDTVSDRIAREALAGGSSVLDVGVGAGAASLRLSPGRVMGVDPRRVMLDAFAARAAQLGVPHEEVEGSWPDVAGVALAADVAVCHHVGYSVADLAQIDAPMSCQGLMWGSLFQHADGLCHRHGPGE